MPFEAGMARELRAAHLSPPPLQIDTIDKVGQTSSAVVLGGLRTLVATFLNLRAFSFFEEKRWDDVADTYDLIVDLAPRTIYYWDSGSWHSAYNAASFYINDSKLPPLRRKEAWRKSIARGRAFLERGVRNNPDNWNLWAQLGFLLSDSNKIGALGDTDKAFAEAADAYRRAADTGNALAYVRRAEFFSLARVKGREREALELGHALYADKANRTPTLQTLVFVLEAHENPSMDLVARAVGIFGTPEKAYESLTSHWIRTREMFPVYGVAAAMELLEKQLAIPPEKSVFKQPLPPPGGPDAWFTK